MDFMKRENMFMCNLHIIPGPICLFIGFITKTETYKNFKDVNEVL